MIIRNVTQNTVIAANAEAADTALKRMAGLLGREALNAGEALVITPCQSIHMLFMKFAIDVIFIDRQGTVVGLCSNIRPFQFSPLFFKAHSAIEVPTGTICSTKTCLGDKIVLD